MTGRKYPLPDWLIYSLILAITLAGCSPPQPLATAEPPTPLPSSTPPPTATPDPSSLFEQQLETARQDGYLPASYTGDPAGAPVLVSEINLAPLRDLGLLPLSLDGLELGRTAGEQLVLPHLEAIPYPNPATGELAIYTFSDTDGAWNLYTNHGGPILKVPVVLPTSLADLVGVYNAPDRDPALVAAKLMPDGSIQIIPIVFTDDENVAFGAQSVIKDGQKVFYNQLTSAWEPLPAPTPTETATQGAPDTGIYVEDGKTLFIEGKAAYSIIGGKLKKWNETTGRYSSATDRNNRQIDADKIIPTDLGAVAVNKYGSPVALVDEDGNLKRISSKIEAGGKNYEWDHASSSWAAVKPTPVEAYLTEPIRSMRPLEEWRKLKYVSVDELLPTTFVKEKKYLRKVVNGHLAAYEINPDRVVIYLLLKNNRILKTQITAAIRDNAMATANNFPVFDGGKITAQEAREARVILDQMLQLQSEVFIQVGVFPTQSDCRININPYRKSACSVIDDGRYPPDNPAKLDSAVSGMIKKAPADLTWDELMKMPVEDIGANFTLQGR